MIKRQGAVMDSRRYDRGTDAILDLRLVSEVGAVLWDCALTLRDLTPSSGSVRIEFSVSDTLSASAENRELLSGAENFPPILGRVVMYWPSCFSSRVE